MYDSRGILDHNKKSFLKICVMAADFLELAVNESHFIQTRLRWEEE